MDNDFFLYLEKMEYLAFFSGYALLYACIMVIAQSFGKEKKWGLTLTRLLPYSYAVTGLLYIGFSFDKLYPDISFTSLKLLLSHSWLTPWAFSTALFLIPALSRKIIFSLIHSLPFFYLLVKSIYSYYTAGTGAAKPVNEMHMYGISLLIQSVVLLACIIIYLLLRKIRPLKN